MTPYFIFTPDGGRIGRIHWRNTNSPSPLIWQRPGWGQCAWDSLWPLPQPERSALMESMWRCVFTSIAQGAERFASIEQNISAALLERSFLRLDPGEQVSFVSPDVPEPTELW
jgi:hypothetical protein